MAPQALQGGGSNGPPGSQLKQNRCFLVATGLVPQPSQLRGVFTSAGSSVGDPTGVLSDVALPPHSPPPWLVWPRP